MTSSVSGKRSPAELIAQVLKKRGGDGNRTRVHGFAGRCLATRPLHRRCFHHGADDGIRTRDPHLGKVMRYQLRYIRTADCELGTENLWDLAPLFELAPITLADNYPLCKIACSQACCAPLTRVVTPVSRRVWEKFGCSDRGMAVIVVNMPVLALLVSAWTN